MLKNIARKSTEQNQEAILLKRLEDADPRVIRINMIAGEGREVIPIETIVEQEEIIPAQDLRINRIDIIATRKTIPTRAAALASLACRKRLEKTRFGIISANTARSRRLN